MEGSAYPSLRCAMKHKKAKGYIHDGYPLALQRFHKVNKLDDINRHSQCLV